MISMLDINAYTLKIFFNFFGRLGSPLLNFGLAKDLDLFSNLPYGIEAEQRLDILRPRPATPEPLPVLIFFHGGGWISADKKIYKGIAATFARNGFLTVNINYRLAPKNRFPAPLQDAIQAIDWVRRNTEGYGGDPSAIVLAGDSAGAQIASWYASALHDDELFYEVGGRRDIAKVAVKGLVLFYGVYDFDSVLSSGLPFIRTYARSFLGADAQLYAKNSKFCSPIRRVSPGLPPVWLCAGEQDGLFSQSEAYAEALKNQGVSCQTMFFSDEYRANHGFLFFRWLKSSRIARAAALEFLRDCARAVD